MMGDKVIDIALYALAAISMALAVAAAVTLLFT